MPLTKIYRGCVVQLKYLFGVEYIHKSMVILQQKNIFRYYPKYKLRRVVKRATKKKKCFIFFNKTRRRQ